MSESIVERACELAPECGSIAEVKRKLIAEGHERVNAHLSGAEVRRQIVQRLDPELKDRSR